MKQMKPQRKYRLGTASNNNCGGGGWGGGEGGGGGGGGGYGMPTFTHIFRRGLHNLIGCSARMEVS